MKKTMLMILAMFTFNAQAAEETPAECKAMIDAMIELVDISPEAAVSEKGEKPTKENMLKEANEEWANADEDERKEILKSCKDGVEEIKKMIEILKSVNK